MFNGRHLLMLGLLAVAGLVSIRDSECQVNLGYDLAKTELQLKKLRQELEFERARLQGKHRPALVIEKSKELNLDLSPASPLSPYRPEGEPTPAVTKPDVAPVSASTRTPRP
jgi:hypothetical protein